MGPKEISACGQVSLPVCFCYSFTMASWLQVHLPDPLGAAVPLDFMVAFHDMKAMVKPVGISDAPISTLNVRR